MKPFTPLLLGLAVIVAAVPYRNTSARAVPVGYEAVRFQLHVGGAHDPRMTFWVAYGPLAGTFGLIRLHSSGKGTYTATRTLPSTDRSVFSYVAGTGTMMTKLGPAPGPPTITIGRVGPTTAGRATRKPMDWRGPIG